MLPQTLTLFATMIFGFLLFGLTLLRNRGSPSVMWALTTLPFVLMVVNLIADAKGYVRWTVFEWMEFPALGIVMCALAIFLFGVTNGTHRELPCMWHQDHDRANHLVTWGIYAFIRHPYYTSYLIFFAACIIARPTVATFSCAAYAYLILFYTAVKEERELTRIFGDEYTAYVSRTNRFMPGQKLVDFLYRSRAKVAS